MKIKNIIKKSTEIVAKASVEKLEKKQLERVVGGIDLVIKEASTAQTQTTEKPRN